MHNKYLYYFYAHCMGLWQVIFRYEWFRLKITFVIYYHLYTTHGYSLLPCGMLLYIYQLLWIETKDTCTTCTQYHIEQCVQLGSAFYYRQIHTMSRWSQVVSLHSSKKKSKSNWFPIVDCIWYMHMYRIFWTLVYTLVAKQTFLGKNMCAVCLIDY